MSKVVPLSSALDDRTLLRELNHRMANDFASAINFVSVAAVRTDDPDVKTALSSVVELLHQHADLHRALAMPDCDKVVDATEYLRKLGSAISRSRLERMNIEFGFAADYLLLESDRCWRLGLAVNELLTNSARHACFDNRNGEIRVELRRGGTLVNCRVSDNGSSTTRIRLQRGLRIVNDLATSLGGRFRRIPCGTGTSFALQFPITEREMRANRVAGSLRTETIPRLATMRQIPFYAASVPGSARRFATDTTPFTAKCS